MLKLKILCKVFFAHFEQQQWEKKCKACERACVKHLEKSDFFFHCCSENISHMQQILKLG